MLVTDEQLCWAKETVRIGEEERLLALRAELKANMDNAAVRGDIDHWTRAARKYLRLGFGLFDQPPEIVVPPAFYAALDAHQRQRNDLLGGDVTEYTGNLLFQRVPVIYEAQPLEAA